MMRLYRGFAVLALALAAATAASADNPELSARVGAAPRAEPLAIGKLDIQVTIVGDTAHTVVTAAFLNPSSTAVEGEFVFDLPRNSVVTGYALDINGHMVDGVLVGARQARLTYEARVRRGLDPGLAEVTRSGAFKTHVFPILPGKGRTVQLTFDTPIEPGKAYRLPLHTARAVGQLTYHVIAADAGMNMRGPGSWVIMRHNGRLFGDGNLQGRPLNGDFVVTPGEIPPVLLARHRSGEVFFEIDDAVPPARHTAVPAHVRLYWDSSLSRRDADLYGEIALIGRYIETVHPAHLDVVFFAAGAPQIRSFDHPTAAGVMALLKATDYQGGTSLQSLFAADLPPADMCLFFSDGNVTAESWSTAHPPCPLMAVASVRDANRPLLGLLARKSGGAFIDLTATTPEVALAMLRRQTPAVTEVRAADGSAVDFVALPVEGDRIRIVGRLPAAGDLTVKLARSGIAERHYHIDRRAIGDAGTLASLWALRRIDDMQADEHPDRDALVAFSRRYSVASPAASFVVFENLTDYVEAGVAPPATVGREVLERYQRMKAEADAAKAQAAAGRLNAVIALWDEERAWWVKPDLPQAPLASGRRTRGPMNDRSARASLSSALPPPPPPPPAPMTGLRSSGGVEDVVVTGARPGGGEDNAPTITVHISEWSPDRPYIHALEAATPDRYWYVYREQEKTYGASPAFYLDVAEFMARHQRTQDAVRIVLNALELPAADVSTMIIVADRLLRYGDGARAIWLYERILFLAPDRPQPRRNLALALAAQADRETDRAAKIAGYRRALDLYNQIITHPWNGVDNGIEVVSLMEANRLVAKLAALGVTDVPLDPRLIAKLDVDLRIVMEWNTDGTDMDLWVDEPTGERAIYNHPRTMTGGRLSNDMRNGYGPEEYLLHRAPNGTYTVRVNVFATDRLNPNGATVVRAHIFRNYGRPDEQEQVLEIELSRADHDAHVIGQVTVSGSDVPLPTLPGPRVRE